MAPRFITFEGLDGSGKSTHLRRASACLEKLGVNHLVTHEPGGTPLGEAIRQVFLDHEWTEMDGAVEALLVFASRRDHLVNTIEPALAQGKTVLCDRFTDSTIAYQGYGRGMALPMLKSLEQVATGGREPDLTLMFDLPADAARARGFSKAERADGADLDRLDVERLEFYERVRMGYLELVEQNPDRIVVVDASGTIEDTEEQVRKFLSDLWEDEA